jgi:hypothetical protein
MFQQQEACPGPNGLAFMVIEVTKVLALHGTAELTSLYQRSPRLVVLNKMDLPH